MGIERIVRPYALPQNTIPLQIFSSAASQSVAPVELKIGASGKGKTYTGSFSASSSSYLAQAASEERDGF